MSRFRKVYVLFPQGVRTGGPKCLHQFVKVLRDLGVDACLSPLSGTESALPVRQYEVYGCPVEEAEDSSDCLIVSPENSLKDLSRFCRAGKAIWWLSVDFAVPFEVEKALERRAGVTKILKIVARHLIHGEYLAFLRLRRLGLKNVYHFAHSEYCRETIQSRFGLAPLMLSDYTEPETGDLRDFASETAIRVPKRVAYNPKKGGREAGRIASLMPQVEFVPVQGMTQEEVIGLLKSCSAYLDLGHFPGKDHLPREANRVGTPVVLARRGAARFEKDFALEPRFRLSLAHRGWEKQVVEVVSSVLDDPVATFGQQESFTTQVLQEKTKFVDEVETVVSSLKLEKHLLGG